MSSNHEIHPAKADDSPNSKSITGFWTRPFGKFIHGVLVAVAASPIIILIGIAFNYHFAQKKSEANSPETNTNRIHNKVATTYQIPHKEPSLSDIAKQQKIENWRKEIQDCTKNGYFNREQFLASKTYYEIKPYISDKINHDLTTLVYTFGDRERRIVSNRLLIGFPDELIRIANEYK